MKHDKALNVGWTVVPLEKGELFGAYDSSVLDAIGNTAAVNGPIEFKFPDGEVVELANTRVRFTGQTIWWAWPRWLRWIERLWRWKTGCYELQMHFVVLPKDE